VIKFSDEVAEAEVMDREGHCTTESAAVTHGLVVRHVQTRCQHNWRLVRYSERVDECSENIA
jgi:hypothetical protein